MKIRFDIADMNIRTKPGVAFLDESGGRMVYLETRFTWDAPDGLEVRGRLAASGSTDHDGIGLQDLRVSATPDRPILLPELRAIPWGKLFDAALDHGAIPLVGNTQKVKGSDMRRKQRRPRSTLDDDHYRQVAKLYREAIRAHLSPVIEVAKGLIVSHDSAKAYVTESRRRGFLEPAPGRGAKGEKADG